MPTEGAGGEAPPAEEAPGAATAAPHAEEQQSVFGIGCAWCAAASFMSALKPFAASLIRATPPSRPCHAALYASVAATGRLPLWLVEVYNISLTCCSILFYATVVSIAVIIVWELLLAA
eukprot:gene5830-17974_t